MKKWLGLAAKILVSCALIWWLFRGKDLGAQWSRVAGADPVLLVAACGALLLQVAIVAFRWRVVLRGIAADLSFAQAFRFFYVGSFFNQALPASVGGDAVRIYMAHKAGLRLGQAFNSAMLDRVAALLAIALMMVAMLPNLFARVGEPSARFGIVVMVVLAVVGVGLLMALDRLPSALYAWRPVRALAALAGDARRVFLSASTAPRVMSVAVLGHVNLALSVWLLARALGIDVSAFDCILMFPPVILISSLPVSIAGWGVREGAMVAAFGFVGVAQGPALVLSIVYGLATIAVNLPGGVVWLLGGDRLAAAKAMDSTES